MYCACAACVLRGTAPQALAASQKASAADAHASDLSHTVHQLTTSKVCVCPFGGLCRPHQWDPERHEKAKAALLRLTSVLARQVQVEVEVVVVVVVGPVHGHMEHGQHDWTHTLAWRMAVQARLQSGLLEQVATFRDKLAQVRTASEQAVRGV